MRSTRTLLRVTAIAIAAGAAAAPTAGAATKTVTMGPPPGAKFAQDVFVNDFFPRNVTIEKGDTVRFLPTGFHTVDFPAKGSGPLPFASPTGQTATETDAAGQPFWFTGKAPVLGFNPPLMKSGYGKRYTYTGAARVESGLPFQARPKAMSVRFTKAGTHTYFCDLHPGMKGTVKVLSRGDAPTARQDAARVANQAKQAQRSARDLRRHRPPTGTVDLGAAGPNGIEVGAFFPKTQTVPVGTTVRFQVPNGSYEAHTATTGPGDLNNRNDSSSYLATLARSFESPQFDPRATYPSEPPGSPAATLTPSLHGNGFWNTGVLDKATVTPLPASGAVKFGQAGTYKFFCLIHPFMSATITAA